MLLFLSVDRHLGIRAAGVPGIQCSNMTLSVSLQSLTCRPNVGFLPFIFGTDRFNKSITQTNFLALMLRMLLQK